MTDLEKLQEHTYYALEAFDDFAKKYDLAYSLGFGTLLGAIRHEGFIPWDDDIDIVMERREYENFLNLAKDKFDEDFFIQNHLTDGNTYHFFSRICVKNTVALQSHFKYIDDNKGIFIDVFAYDHMPQKKYQARHLNQMIFLKRLKRIPSPNPGNLDRLGKALKKIFPKTLSYKNINKRLDKVAQKYNDQKTEYLYCSGDATATNDKGVYYYYTAKIPSHSFDSLCKRKFRDREYLVFENYDEILTMTYGDYMQLPKESNRTPHHGFEKFVFRDDVLNRYK